MKVNCLTCNKEFEKPMCWIKRHPRSYCSKVCASKGHSQYMLGKDLGGSLVRKCLYCKSNFRTYKSQNKRFCSKKCVDMYKVGTLPWNTGLTKNTSASLFQSSKKHLGENNSMFGKYGDKSGNWQGGKTSLQMMIRTSDRYFQWRSDVFKRDNYKCLICGKNSNKLHVDHIVPFSVIVYENKIKTLSEANNCELLWNIDNGQTICQECHKKKTINDYAKIYWRPYAS